MFNLAGLMRNQAGLFGSYSMMKFSILRHLVFLALSVLLCSCAADFPSIHVGSESAPTAHLASVGVTGGRVAVFAVNGTGIEGLPGRDIVMPAGNVNLKIHYLNGVLVNTTEMRYNFEGGGYYLLNGDENMEMKTVRYNVKSVSQQEFQLALCSVQRAYQASLAGLKSVKAPACEVFKQ